MVGLRALQEDFQSLMLGEASGIVDHVVGTQRVPVATRLAIYSDGYALRLTEALEANYPALAKLLGAGEFATLSRAYIDTHGSSFPSIRYYGHDLPRFLESDPAYVQVPLLAELARWEWTMTEVFDAADSDSLGVAELAAVASERWASLTFAFSASLRLLALHWNAPQIWKALSDDDERPQAAVQAGAARWLLWRQDLRTIFRSLEAPEADALELALGGASFGQICEGVGGCFTVEETPARAAAYLRQWVDAGLIVGLR